MSLNPASAGWCRRIFQMHDSLKKLALICRDFPSYSPIQYGRGPAGGTTDEVSLRSTFQFIKDVAFRVDWPGFTRVAATASVWVVLLRDHLFER
jgi:hypothetical protein